MVSPAGCGCDWDCCHGHAHMHGHGMHHFRHFTSKQEIKERLEHYEDQLKKELAGVEERIQELENS